MRREAVRVDTKRVRADDVESVATPRKDAGTAGGPLLLLNMLLASSAVVLATQVICG